MSDGPHRCLNMRKPWKSAAKVADNPAFSEAEVDDRASRAIRSDWTADVPANFMSALRVCFSAGEQVLQLPPTMEVLAGLRHMAPGSAFVATLADCAEDAAARGLVGDAAIQEIVRAALEERVERSLRHVQEIYQRESSDGRTRRVLDRLSPSLNRAVSTLTQEIVQAARPVRAAPVAYATGVEQGPPL
jgi:hypothetical protein